MRGQTAAESPTALALAVKGAKQMYPDARIKVRGEHVLAIEDNLIRFVVWTNLDPGEGADAA